MFSERLEHRQSKLADCIKTDPVGEALGNDITRQTGRPHTKRLVSAQKSECRLPVLFQYLHADLKQV